MTIKNFWSMNTDEVLAANEIREKLGKRDYEMFLPLNSQLKDIDLVLIDLKKMRPISIQVKGSRTYVPYKSETQRYGEGSSAWITIEKKKIFQPTHRIDFFIFVLHNLVETETKKQIKINYLIIPASDLKRLIAEKKVGKGDIFQFFIWIDDKGKRSFDFYEKDKPIYFSKYLDNWEILKN